jgi:hypothetical protein
MSSLSFPEELDFHSLRSIYPCSKSELRKNPINGSSFITGDIQLILPKSEMSFADPNTLCVNFTVAYTMAVGTPNTDRSYVIGSGYSHFRRQVIRALSSGQTIETIDNVHLLAHQLWLQSLSSSAKKSLSSTIGFNADEDVTNTSLGHALDPAATATTIYYTYSLPLVGIVNTMKMIPLFVSDIEVTLTINEISNYILQLTANGNCTGITIGNVEIVCEVLTLESDSFSTLMRQAPEILRLKSSSYLYGASSMAASSAAGTYDHVFPHSLNSLKRFLWWSSPANAAEMQFAGVCPNAQSWNLLIGSKSYPQQPVAAFRVANSFMENQKSFAALYSSVYNSNTSRASYAVSSTLGFGDYSVYRIKQTLANTKLRSLANQWSAFLDLEVINQLKNSLYSGISTKGSSNVLRIQTNSALAAQVHTINFFSHFDCIIEFDYKQGAVNVIM